MLVFIDFLIFFCYNLNLLLQQDGVLMDIDNSFTSEQQVANNLYLTLKDYIPVKTPRESSIVNRGFNHFVFEFIHPLNTYHYFNAFIHKSRIIFKADNVDRKLFPTVKDDFCKALNINVTTIDSVINAYLKAARLLEKYGLLSISSDFEDKFKGNSSSYVDFSQLFNQEYICGDYTLARLTFNKAYKKNRQYHPKINSRVAGQIHFYRDKDNNIKPIFEFSVAFDQKYESRFIVDIYEDKVYTTRKLLAARSYEDLITMSRPIDKERLQETMETQFMNRLIPVIKKRCGLSKNEIDLNDLDMRKRYFSLLMMDSI